MADNISSKYNMRSPAVKRICQEIKELQREGDSADFMAQALESDIFEWHFVVRGPPGTEFEGGIYHGRVLLPPEYPFKPPSFMMLSPSGRFETGVKICLSISSHHPEHWQPSWSVRTALTALIAFMPSPGQGALGSLDFSKDERKQLAAKSRTDIPKFGSPARQKVTDDMHKAMLQRQQQQQQQQEEQQPGQEKQQQAPAAKQAPESTAASTAAPAEAAPGAGAQPSPPPAAAAPAPAAAAPTLPSAHERRAGTAGASSSKAGTGLSLSASAAAPTVAATAPDFDTQQWSQQPRQRGAAAAAAANAAAAPAITAPAPQAQPQQTAWPAQAGRQQQRRQGQQGADSMSDRGLTLLAFVLSVAIAALLLKKMAGAWGGLGEIVSSISNF